MLTTQQAADLVGVSRRYIVARIDAGDIPLHLQAGNQRRILQSAVLTWHRQQKCTADGALQNVGCCETVSHTVIRNPLLPLDHQQAVQTRMVKGLGCDRHGALPSLLPSEAISCLAMGSS